MECGGIHVSQTHLVYFLVYGFFSEKLGSVGRKKKTKTKKKNEDFKEAQYIKILFHDSFKHLSRSMVSPSKK